MTKQSMMRHVNGAIDADTMTATNKHLAAIRAELDRLYRIEAAARHLFTEGTMTNSIIASTELRALLGLEP